MANDSPFTDEYDYLTGHNDNVAGSTATYSADEFDTGEPTAYRDMAGAEGESTPQTNIQKFPRKTCVANSLGKQGTAADARKKSFFGQIGGLDILNDVGLGNVGSILREVDEVANVLDLNQSEEGIIGQILGGFGIDGSSLSFLSGLNPGAANGAWNAGKNLYERLKQGNLEINDIGEIVRDIKNVSNLVSGIFYPPAEKKKGVEWCYPSPYATDLISRHPKYKFLFVVEFVFDENYVALRDLNYAFHVKSSTRPNISFEYEDINMYNFRTKALKRSEWSPMTIRFNDDDTNEIAVFYNNYLKAMVPIANIPDERGGPFEERGMDFEAGYRSGRDHFTRVGATAYSGSMGTLLNHNTKNLLKEIRLFHVFNFGHHMNVYKFINPKVSTMTQDDLDMADGSSGGEISMEFTYDSMFMYTHLSMEPNTASSQVGGDSFDVKALTESGQYPLSYNGLQPNTTVDAESATNPIGKELFDIHGRSTASRNDQIKSQFPGFGNSLLDGARDLVEDTLGSIGDTIGDVGDAIGDFFSGSTDYDTSYSAEDYLDL